MKNTKRVMSLLLIGLLVIGMALTTGCSNKSKSSNLDPANSLVVTVGDKTIYLNEMMYYIYAVEAEGEYYNQMYQQFSGGASYWDMEFEEGITMREQTKQYVMDTVVMYEVLYDKAVAAGYTLSEDEIAEANTNAETIMAGITDEQIKITGFTTDILSNVQQKLLLGEKYYNEIIEGLTIDEDEIKATVNYEDYKQYDTEFLYISTIKYDENATPINLTDDEIKTAKATMNTALEKVKAGEEFAAIAEADSTISTSEVGFVYGDETIEAEYQDAAIALDNGDTTNKVIETPNGYYIIKMINNDSKESYDAAVEEAIATVEDEEFTAVYDELLKEYTTTINDAVWDTITMGKTTIVATPTNETE